MLGINAREADRIQVRKKMTCAPIAIENYTTGWTAEQKPHLSDFIEFLPGADVYKYYNLGHSLLLGGLEADYTFVFSNSSLQSQDNAYKLE